MNEQKGPRHSLGRTQRRPVVATGCSSTNRCSVRVNSPSYLLLLPIVDRDVLEFFSFRSGSTQGDGAAFAIGRDNNPTCDCDLAIFLIGGRQCSIICLCIGASV